MLTIIPDKNGFFGIKLRNLHIKFQPSIASNLREKFKVTDR